MHLQKTIIPPAWPRTMGHGCPFNAGVSKPRPQMAGDWVSPAPSVSRGGYFFWGGAYPEEPRPIPDGNSQRGANRFLCTDGS